MAEHQERLRLVYFNVRGIVEPIRLLLALVEADYDDLRYPIRANAAGFAPDPAYLRDKAIGKFQANMNSLPILQVVVDGRIVAEVGQSNAILRYVARRHGVAGASPVEEAIADAVCECVRDIKQRWYKCKQKPEAQKWCLGGDDVDAKDEFFSRDLPELLAHLEAALPPRQCSSPWLVGPTTTVADIVVYHLLASPISLISGCVSSFFDGEKDRVETALAGVPRLRAAVEAVAGIPAIQDWEARRPDTFS